LVELKTQVGHDDPRVFEPYFETRYSHRVGVASAVSRHPLLTIAPVVVLVAIACAASYARTPNYTADTRLAVGRLDASTPSSLAGFTQATQTLAERYARSVRGDEVIDPAGAALGVKSSKIRNRVSAAPIPETPVFRIRARAETPEDATALANTVSESLVRHSQDVATSAGPASRRLLQRYRGAALEFARLDEAMDDRRSEFEAFPSPITQDALAEARSEATVAKLRLSTLQTAYETSMQSAGSAALVEIVERAVKGRSDRSRVTQLLLFIAVVAGLTIGIALALLRANRQLLRSNRQLLR
jgi:capsular polysaccharide biosynthesis protein